MKILDATTTRHALPFDRLIATLRDHFARDDVTVPARHVHDIVAPDGGKLTSLLMPAWTSGQLFGVKVVNICAGNAARGLPGLYSSYLLMDANTGAPLAMLDGNVITSRRTAAAPALAAGWLARPDAQHLLVVGAGEVARLMPMAYAAVRPISRVSVWARSADKAGRLAGQWRNDGFDAHPVTDLESACMQADIVCCATLATEPLVSGRWLQPGSHLDLIGSFTPAMREADDVCFIGSSLFVDTAEALAKSGDLLGPMSRGVFEAADVAGTLSQLARGQVPGRRHPDERTVFKSVGTALEDLAAATLVWRAVSGGV